MTLLEWSASCEASYGSVGVECQLRVILMTVRVEFEL